MSTVTCTLNSENSSLLLDKPTIIELSLNSKDVSKNFVQEKISLGTKGGLYEAEKVKNPVVSYSVDRLRQAYSLVRSKVNDAIHTVYAQGLRDLSHQEFVDSWALINAADLAQKEIDPKVLRKNGVSEKVIDFVETHQELMTKTLESINEARRAVGKKEISARTAYAAMSMSGDFRHVISQYVLDERGQRVLDADGKPKTEVIGVIGANTKWGLENILGKVKDKYGADAIVVSPMQNMGLSKKGNKTQSAFMDILELVGEDRPEIQEFLNVMDEMSRDDVQNFMGMKKHTMQKKGVFGMEGRKFWESEFQNAKDGFTNQMRVAEAALEWSEMAKALKDINEIIHHPDVAVQHPNAIRWVENYAQNAIGINPSDTGRWMNNIVSNFFSEMGMGASIPRKTVALAREVANTAMLSINPSFLAIQLLQGAQAMPAMAAFLRSKGLATSSTLTGYSYMTQIASTFMKDKLGQPLSNIERGALDYARKHYIYSTDMVEHASQARKDFSFYKTKITQSPAAWVEAGTRAQVYLAFVHMMDDAGVKPAQGLYKQAHDFTDMVMNDYGRLEKPPIYNALGPIGSVAYNLKSFGHNELSRWSMYARMIGEQQTLASSVPLLTQMASTIVMAGVMGLPFYSQWEMLYDYITEKLGKPRSLTLDVMNASKSAAEVFGSNAQYALSNGAPTLLGMDLSARIGLGDVIPSHASDAAFAGSGKLVDMITSTGRAVAKPNEANLKHAAITLAPQGLQGMMDVGWYQKDNLALSKDPTKRAHATAVRNDTDILLKKIGISGIHESAQKQRVYQQDQLDRAYANYRSDAMIAISWELAHNNNVSDANIKKYFETGQGDPVTFERDLLNMIQQQQIGPEQAMMMRQIMSQRIPQMQSMVRRAQ